MKSLISGLSVHGLGKAEAKAAAFAVISLLQSRIKSGESVDLGFMKINRKVTKPMAIKCNIGGKKGEDLFIGETSRWEAKVAKHWQKKVKPRWSRWS